MIDTEVIAFMKSVMDRIDAFCRRHPRFGIPRLMMYVVIGNVLVWLFTQMDTTGMLSYYLYFDPGAFLHGQVWRLVTFPLIPTTSGILWLAISLYFYYFIGTSLEREWDTAHFTIYYFCGIVVSVVYSLLVYAITGGRVSVYCDASYINLSMFFAFATLWPDQQVLLFFIIPIRMKWLAIVDAVFFGWSVLRYLLAGYPAYALLPIVAVGNYLLFCGDRLFCRLPFRPRRKKGRVISYREAATAYKAQAKGPYSRRCEVCGRTNESDPGLEFRYCSRCEGFHCFCADHIQNHTHFTS